MSLTVGTDSYITIAEATTLLADYFDTTNFTSGTTADQEKALKKATRVIDLQILKFIKYLYTQALEFPRNCNIYGIDTMGEVPDKIKLCTALEALGILDNREDTDEYTTLKEKGVISQSIADTSITFEKDAVLKENSKMVIFRSREAEQLIKPWIQNTFNRV